jgi:hypothetical protein
MIKNHSYSETFIKTAPIWYGAVNCSALRLSSCVFLLFFIALVVVCFDEWEVDEE